jgi:hypothetical protein
LSNGYFSPHFRLISCSDQRMVLVPAMHAPHQSMHFCPRKVRCSMCCAFCARLKWWSVWLGAFHCNGFLRFVLAKPCWLGRVTDEGVVPVAGWLQLSLCSLPNISSLLQKTFVTMLPLRVAIPMSHNPTSYCKAAPSSQAKQSNTNHGLSDILHLPCRQALPLAGGMQQRKHPNIRCGAGRQDALWSLQANTSCSGICCLWPSGICRFRLPRIRLSRLRLSRLCLACLRLPRLCLARLRFSRLRLPRLRLSRLCLPWLQRSLWFTCL